MGDPLVPVTDSDARAEEEDEDVIVSAEISSAQPRAPIGPTESTTSGVHAALRSSDLVGLEEPKREVRVGLSVLLGFIMMMIGVATFAANYLFATKTEVMEAANKVRADHAKDHRQVEALTNEVRVIQTDVGYIKRAQEKAERTQEVMDENLRKLLLRQGVKPATKARRRRRSGGND
jgi:hypothetical protein